MELISWNNEFGASVIPNDWSFASLGNIAEVDMGQSPVGYSYNRSGFGIPLLNGPTEFTEKYPIKRQWTTQATKICMVDDILLCVRGSSTGRINISNDEYCIGRGIAAIRAKPIADTTYITFQLDSAIQRLLALSAGSTFPNIDGKSIRSISIPFPPNIDEQHAIAAALSDVDALIASLDALIAKKRLIKQAAMQQLLTGKSRLPGFSGEWDAKPLGDLFEISGGLAASRDQLSSEGYCYLHYGDIHLSQKTFIDVESEYQEIPKLKIALNRVSSTTLLNDGDIVFVDASEDDEGTSKHIVIFNKEKIPFISGLHTIVLKGKTNEIDHNYRRYCFQTTAIKRQFRYFAVGIKVSGISKTNIAKVVLPIPSIPE